MSITSGSGGPFVAPPGPSPSPQVGEYGKLGLVASTGPNGFALQNASPVILQWAAPNDGLMHRAIIFSLLVVTSLQTAGAVLAIFDNAGHNLFAGGLAAGSYWPSAGPYPAVVIPPGAASNLVQLQQTAMTAGAATLYAEIWAS